MLAYPNKAKPLSMVTLGNLISSTYNPQYTPPQAQQGRQAKSMVQSSQFDLVLITPRSVHG